MTDENDRIPWKMVGILAQRFKYQLYGDEQGVRPGVEDASSAERTLLLLQMAAEMRLVARELERMAADEISGTFNKMANALAVEMKAKAKAKVTIRPDREEGE